MSQLFRVLLTLSFGFVVRSLPASAADLFVSPKGSDVNNGSSAKSAFHTIQHALEKAAPGDTINLASGTYKQDLRTIRSGTQEKPITIIGPEDAVVTGAGTRIVEINHNYITLKGFTVDGLWGDADTAEGYRDKLIYVQGQDKNSGLQGLKILNLHLMNAGGECLRLRYFIQRSEIGFNSIKNCGIHDFKFGSMKKKNGDQFSDKKMGKANHPTHKYESFKIIEKSLPHFFKLSLGEGIYIGTAPEQTEDGKNPTSDPDGSSGNWMHHNSIDTQGNECVDIKEGATQNIVENNYCTGQKDPESAGLNSRGNGNIFRYNQIENNVGAGVRLGGDTSSDGADNDVYGNSIQNNAAGGIKFQSKEQGQVCENIMEGNQRDAVGSDGELFSPTTECWSEN